MFSARVDEKARKCNYLIIFACLIILGEIYVDLKQSLKSFKFRLHHALMLDVHSTHNLPHFLSCFCNLDFMMRKLLRTKIIIMDIRSSRNCEEISWWIHYGSPSNASVDYFPLYLLSFFISWADLCAFLIFEKKISYSDDVQPIFYFTSDVRGIILRV